MSVSPTTNSDYPYNPSSTTCNFACTCYFAACSVLNMMGDCLAPTTFSTALTSVDGYAAPTPNMNLRIIPNYSTLLSKVVGTYTVLEIDSCYSDFYSGWSPSMRDGPQPTPEEGSGPGHMVPRPQTLAAGSPSSNSLRPSSPSLPQETPSSSAPQPKISFYPYSQCPFSQSTANP